MKWLTIELRQLKITCYHIKMTKQGFALSYSHLAAPGQSVGRCTATKSTWAISVIRNTEIRSHKETTHLFWLSLWIPFVRLIATESCQVCSHGEYRFPEKNSSTFHGLFQGHFRTFQGHFHCRSMCITVKKYRVTGQNLEFPCNLPSSHRSVRTGRWKWLFFLHFLCFFFIEIRLIYNNLR